MGISNFWNSLKHFWDEQECNNYWDYICYICKPRDIAELHRSLNCWVENNPICMMTSCVGFEVYKFSEPSLLGQQFFQCPPFGCLKIFEPPPLNIFIPPCHIKGTFPNLVFYKEVISVQLSNCEAASSLIVFLWKKIKICLSLSSVRL